VKEEKEVKREKTGEKKSAVWILQ